MTEAEQITTIALLGILFLTTHTTIQIKTAQENTNPPAFFLSQEEYTVYQWLEHNTPDDSVIATPSFYQNWILPVHTHNKHLLVPGVNSIATTDELISRACQTYKLFNVSENYIRLVYNRTRTQSHTDYRSVWDIEMAGHKYIWSDMQLHNNSFDTAQQLLDHCKRVDETFRVDYLFYGPHEKFMTRTDFEGHELLYDNGKYKIYAA